MIEASHPAKLRKRKSENNKKCAAIKAHNYLPAIHAEPLPAFSENPDLFRE